MKLHVLAIAVACALTACQSLPNLTQATQQGQTSQLTQDTNAEQLLTQAIKKQLRSNFSYQSEVVAIYVPSDEVAQSDCSDVHENGYVALAQRAKAEGLDLSADRYLPDIAQLKADYLACKSAEDVSDWQTYPSQTDIRRAELLQGYLLKPTDITISGSYRPLAGFLTILPEARYTSNNLKALINEPIYIDLKTQTLYLWADNLALLNATWLDKDLGDSWHNKWLKIALNDGSLPKDFVKDVLELYRDAQLQTLAGQVSFAEPTDLDLPKADIIITKTTDEDSHEALRQAFFEPLLEKYPELATTPTFNEEDSEHFTSLKLWQMLVHRIQNQSISDASTVTYYGLSGGGDLLWSFAWRMDDGDLVSILPNTQFALKTTFNPTPKTNDFPRLPATANKPNAQNSVDFLLYGNTLFSNVRQSNSVVLKSLAYYLFGADDEYESYDDEYDCSCIEEAEAVEAETQSTTTDQDQ